MSKEYESADLILKLYDLRREATMRQARAWFAGFNPDTVEEVIAAARGEHSAYFRMVTTYWDMACSLVNNNAIEERMFAESGGEQNYIFAKIQPFLAQVRETIKQPNYLINLERFVMRQPDAEQRLVALRELSRRMASQPATTDTAAEQEQVAKA